MQQSFSPHKRLVDAILGVLVKDGPGGGATPRSPAHVKGTYCGRTKYRVRRRQGTGPSPCMLGWLRLPRLHGRSWRGADREAALPPLRRGGSLMEGRDLQELRGDLHDLYDAIGGLGIELAALNMSVRSLTAHLTGEDPLRDSLYYGGPVEEAAPEPPSWVNASGAGEAYPPPARDNLNSAVGLIVLAAVAGSLASILFLLYVLL